jgi:hypothetical protein
MRIRNTGSGSIGSGSANCIIMPKRWAIRYDCRSGCVTNNNRYRSRSRKSRIPRFGTLVEGAKWKNVLRFCFLKDTPYHICMEAEKVWEDIQAVLRNRIRMDPHLICPPDPASECWSGSSYFSISTKLRANSDPDPNTSFLIHNTAFK